MSIQEHRKMRLRELIDFKCGGVIATLASHIERNESYVSRMLYPSDKAGARPITDKMMLSIEGTFGLERAWLDKPLGYETGGNVETPASSPENQWPFSFHLLTRYQAVMTALPKRKALQASRDIESLVDVAVSKWERVAASEKSPVVSGIAGDVLARNLTTNTRDFAPAKKPA